MHTTERLRCILRMNALIAAIYTLQFRYVSEYIVKVNNKTHSLDCVQLLSVQLGIWHPYTHKYIHTQSYSLKHNRTRGIPTFQASKHTPSRGSKLPNPRS